MMVKWKGKYCASSGFLDLADNCRNPDGCVCAYMQTAYTRAEAAERDKDEALSWAANTLVSLEALERELKEARAEIERLKDTAGER